MIPPRAQAPKYVGEYSSMPPFDGLRPFVLLAAIVRAIEQWRFSGNID